MLSVYSNRIWRQKPKVKWNVTRLAGPSNGVHGSGKAVIAIISYGAYSFSSLHGRPQECFKQGKVFLGKTFGWTVKEKSFKSLVRGINEGCRRYAKFLCLSIIWYKLSINTNTMSWRPLFPPLAQQRRALRPRSLYFASPRRNDKNYIPRILWRLSNSVRKIWIECR